MFFAVLATYTWMEGRIILKMDFKEIGWEGVEWIHVAQVRDRWWAVVTAAVNPLVFD
jgi:hypothetical protein